MAELYSSLLMVRIPPTLVLALLLALSSCRKTADAPAEAYGAFYTGVAALQVGQDSIALDQLTKTTQLAPGEPAAWADLGILQMRQQQFDNAAASVEKAREQAPDNSRIEALLAQLESKRGNVPSAIAHFKKAVELDGRNVKALYAAAEETERQATATSDADAEALFQKILTVAPGNLATMIDVARLAAKRGDQETFAKTVAALAQSQQDWPDAAKKQLTTIQQTPLQSAAVQFVFLRNLLARVPAYRQSLDEVKVPAMYVADPFTQLLVLKGASHEPAAPDTGLQFTTQPIAGAPQARWTGAIALDAEHKPAVLWADDKTLHSADGLAITLPGAVNAVLGADLNYDFKTDLVVASAAGLRIFNQEDAVHFKDVTAATKLPAAVLNAAYSGAWAFDFDLDGDLDIVVGSQKGEPVVLRNNGDGTFAVVHPFHGVDGVAAFSYADIDEDGTPDVAMIDGDGQVVAFRNERLGNYLRIELPTALGGKALDVTAGDINGDGRMDFLVLKDDYSVVRFNDKETADVVHAAAPHAGKASLLVADLDNNGALDLIVGDQVFLNDGQKLNALAQKLSAGVASAFDLDGSGRLALIEAGRPAVLTSRGAKNYHWQTIRTKAAQTKGDQRINSFGIGASIEARAGLLTQKQMITGPQTHFGLGEQSRVDFSRIIWPNGSVQAEFALQADTTVLAVQRLKGSCPFLFAWNGKQFQFVKDTAPWAAALGLHVNGEQVAGIYRTEEWFKIPNAALAPRDGFYELRVTGEYWETFYIDHYSLMMVDHPQGTEVFADERFAVPPPALRLYNTRDPQPFASAIDDHGADVSELVRNSDARYLDTFARGQYQGVAQDHYVELTLPESAPRTGPLYLIAEGWMHPTDATTNVALGQSGLPKPESLSIEIQTANGQWKTAQKNLGFPSGRMKTVVLDISGLHKLRLRTNLEIYWDKLAWAEGLNSVATMAPAEPAGAELGYRGFSQITSANASSPEVPNYQVVAETGPKWHDLQGYYTRYGDVSELLQKVDDRMVIMNAGDELRLRFRAPSPVKPGWVRDFVMVGDGWIKDGDYNCTFSNTVLPLPYHGMKDYTKAPATLEEDRAYLLHPNDWRTYHTRYVTPNYFNDALWNQQRGTH